MFKIRSFLDHERNTNLASNAIFEQHDTKRKSLKQIGPFLFLPALHFWDKVKKHANTRLLNFVFMFLDPKIRKGKKSKDRHSKGAVTHHRSEVVRTSCFDEHTTEIHTNKFNMTLHINHKKKQQQPEQEKINSPPFALSIAPLTRLTSKNTANRVSDLR